MKKLKEILKGAVSTFDITGLEGLHKDLEYSREKTIQHSWENVGIYFKKSFNEASVKVGKEKKYSDDLNPTY
jgi:hypothetical protein